MAGTKYLGKTERQWYHHYLYLEAMSQRRLRREIEWWEFEHRIRQMRADLTALKKGRLSPVELSAIHHRIIDGLMVSLELEDRPDKRAWLEAELRQARNDSGLFPPPPPKADKPLDDLIRGMM